MQIRTGSDSSGDRLIALPPLVRTEDGKTVLGYTSLAEAVALQIRRRKMRVASKFYPKVTDVAQMFDIGFGLLKFTYKRYALTTQRVNVKALYAYNGHILTVSIEGPPIWEKSNSLPRVLIEDTMGQISAELRIWDGLSSDDVSSFIYDLSEKVDEMAAKDSDPYANMFTDPNNAGSLLSPQNPINRNTMFKWSR